MLFLFVFAYCRHSKAIDNSTPPPPPRLGVSILPLPLLLGPTHPYLSPPPLSYLSLFLHIPLPLSPFPNYLSLRDRLIGLVVRRPPRERKVPGLNPACGRIFSGSSHTSDLKIGTPVATLPGAWRYRVSTGTGRNGVSIL